MEEEQSLTKLAFMLLEAFFGSMILVIIVSMVRALAADQIWDWLMSGWANSPGPVPFAGMFIILHMAGARYSRGKSSGEPVLMDLAATGFVEIMYCAMTLAVAAFIHLVGGAF